MANNIQNTEIRDWVIYKITSPSGRIYIGKTNNFKKRKRQYASDINTKSQPLIYNSIKKYGHDKHIFDVVESFRSTSSYCNGKEMFWIRTYMSNYSKWPECNGLNLTDGGKSTIGWKPSEETKMKISIGNRKPKGTEFSKMRATEVHTGHKYNLGRKHTKEHRDKIVESRRKSGKKVNRGPASEATKLKMSITRTGKHIKRDKSKYQNKPGVWVLQYGLDGNLLNKFRSISKASKETGIGYHTIRRECLRDKPYKYRRIDAGNFIFKFNN